MTDATTTTAHDGLAPPRPSASESAGGAVDAGPRASSHLVVFSRSTLTSLFTTALDYLTLFGLTGLLGVNYVAATWAGTVVGSLSNFSINKLWAFDAKHLPTGAQFGRFLIVQSGSSALSAAGVWAFTRFGGVSSLLASKTLVAALVYLCWNFPLNRAYVFRHRSSAADASPTP